MYSEKIITAATNILDNAEYYPDRGIWEIPDSFIKELGDSVSGNEPATPGSFGAYVETPTLRWQGRYLTSPNGIWLDNPDYLMESNLYNLPKSGMFHMRLDSIK